MNTVILACKYEIRMDFSNILRKNDANSNLLRRVVLSSYKMVAVFCLRVGTVSSSFSIISVEQEKKIKRKKGF